MRRKLTIVEDMYEEGNRNKNFVNPISAGIGS